MSPAEEIRDGLASEFPRKTISVGEIAWAEPSPAINNYTEYMISIQPGFDGHLSQNFAGNSFDECLEKLRKAVK